MIRTREGRFRPLTAFEAVPFVRSGTPPQRSLATPIEAIRGIIGAYGARGEPMDGKELEGVPLFEGLSRKQRDHVARWADAVDLPAGYHLADQGAFAHEFFALLDGRVDVIRDGVCLVELGPGDFFGEIALVEHDRRTATVTAVTPVTAVVMHARDFDAMRAEFPEIAERIHEAVHARSPRHQDDDTES